MIQRPMKAEQRTPEQIRVHYEIEKELANRLRYASKQERRYLYSSLYDELYQRVPFHPQLTRKLSRKETIQAISSPLKLLKRFVNNETTFLEIGPGDCALSFEMAKFVKKVYAVDVSDEITKASKTPENFQLIISDGSSIPVSPNIVNVAYSNNLMEHLHPDDSFEQLRNIYNALVPGGVYICITPSRLTGPHDVSRFYDEIATGFHLKEYTFFELNTLFISVGFSKVRAYVGAKGFYLRSSVKPLVFFERSLNLLPKATRKAIAHSLPFRALFNIRLVGIK